MKRLLMVAYHFPPLAGSSGIQRTLRFVKHLPALGWMPVVLTVKPQAYERTSDDLVAEIPPNVHVERASALDAARHLSLAGRYPRVLARPDRWVSWRWWGMRAGLRLVRRFAPHAVWSTFPIATAHMIGGALARRCALPWIADFRDPMAQEGYPEDAGVWRSYKRIEETVMQDARLAVFTTPGAAQDYRTRYPGARARIAVIENGFDEEDFAALTANAPQPPLTADAPTLLHSGIVYPSERDPTRLFEALARLKAQEPARAPRVRFRAPGDMAWLQALARRYGVADCVDVLPPVAYRVALDEMMRADGLLLLQAANCNAQIPAKLYEYLRARRPIVALTDARGDTAATLRSAGIDTIAALDDAGAIAALLARFVARRDLPLPDPETVQSASREGRARELAALLDEAVT